MKLNEKIYYYRKKAKLSQEELAARVGVSRQAVSKWELGDATPELDKLVALAMAFGVTTDELLSPDEPEEAPQGDGARPSASPPTSCSAPMSRRKPPRGTAPRGRRIPPAAAMLMDASPAQPLLPRRAGTAWAFWSG